MNCPYCQGTDQAHGSLEWDRETPSVVRGRIHCENCGRTYTVEFCPFVIYDDEGKVIEFSGFLTKRSSGPIDL